MANPNCFPKECFSIFKSIKSSPPCPKGGSCIKLGQLTVEPKKSVTACQETGFVDFSCFDFTGCINAPTFQIKESCDLDALSSYSFDQTGFTFTTSGKLVDKIEILFQAHCLNEDDCVISDFGKLIIYLRDYCKEVPTPEGCNCNPCNGEYICTEGDEFPHLDGPDFPTETTTSCTDPVTYTIKSYDDRYFTNVTIDTSGNINYDLVCSDLLKVSFTSKIHYAAEACGAVDESIETIAFTPLCAEITCPINEVCNHCTGLCEKIECDPPFDGTSGNEGAGGDECPTKDVIKTVYSPKPNKPYNKPSTNKEVCVTNVTPVPEPIDPCEAILAAFKTPCQKNCIKCEVIDGEACITDIEEVFPLEELLEYCPDQMVELTGSCCGKKTFKGQKVETWNNRDESVCLGDPYEVVGSCGTIKEFIGTQEESWDCGDPSTNCGTYFVESNCGNQVACQGTATPTIINPLKESVLSKICSNEFVDCADTCGGTIRVFGTKDCGTVDPCAGVTCDTGFVCVNGVCECNLSDTDWSPTTSNTCPQNTVEQTRRIDCVTEARTVNGTSTDASCNQDLCENNTCSSQNFIDNEVFCEAPDDNIRLSYDDHVFTCDSNTGNCVETVTTIMTGNTCPGCTDSTWTPDPTTVCAGEAFTQMSNCGNSRQSVGTLPFDTNNCQSCSNGVVSDNCAANETCDGNGNCVDNCTPTCNAPNCGQSDGCEGTCPDTDDVCPDLSTISCGVEYVNMCGVSCGFGTANSPSTCESCVNGVLVSDCPTCQSCVNEACEGPEVGDPCMNNDPCVTGETIQSDCSCGGGNACVNSVTIDSACRDSNNNDVQFTGSYNLGCPGDVILAAQTGAVCSAGTITDNGNGTFTGLITSLNTCPNTGQLQVCISSTSCSDRTCETINLDGIPSC